MPHGFANRAKFIFRLRQIENTTPKGMRSGMELARDRDRRRGGPMINGNIRRYNAPSHRKPVKYDSRPITRVQKTRVKND